MNFYIRIFGSVLTLTMGLATPAASETSETPPELSELESEIEAMQRDYDARIRTIEEQVKAAGDRPGGDEPPATTGAPSAAEPSAEPQTATVREEASAAWSKFSRTFNPSVTAILQGRVAYLEGWEGERNIEGFPIGGSVDRGHEGISLGESELVFSANVDDKLYGFFDVSFDQDDIEVEEAFLSTLSLPFGLGVKAGQFLSSIGYHNNRHPHSWDFVDPPLVYETMLGGSFSDAGVQVTWVAPTDLYFELGGEVFRGDSFPADGAEYHGFGSATAFAKLSGDVGDSGSWQAGVSYLRAESDSRESEVGDESITFDGSSDVAIVDFVWKWAPRGNFRERNFTFQTEYMHRREKGDLGWDGGGGRYHSDPDGFYVQSVYQFIPRWRAGLRYGQLWGDSRVSGQPPEASAWDDGSSSRRITTMLDFSNSEFSRFRLQYSFASGALGDDSLVYLQYIISIGSHGAHAF